MPEQKDPIVPQLVSTDAQKVIIPGREKAKEKSKKKPSQIETGECTTSAITLGMDSHFIELLGHFSHLCSSAH